MSEEPNYKVMELENDLVASKDELIKVQKALIENLQKEIIYLKGLIKPNDDERDVGSNMIAPPNFEPPKPRIRTVSEVSTMLERRSYNAANATKSAEEISNVGQNS